MLQSTALPLLLGVVGSDDPATIANAVLSAYGLPTFKTSKALRMYDGGCVQAQALVLVLLVLAAWAHCTALAASALPRPVRPPCRRV